MLKKVFGTTHTHNLAVLFNCLIRFKFTQFPLMLPNDGTVSEEV